MTGRELIIYILENGLEDEEVINDGIFIGYIDEYEIAEKFKVGVETVRAWHQLGWLEGVKINDSLYFLKNVSDPRITPN